MAKSLKKSVSKSLKNKSRRTKNRFSRKGGKRRNGGGKEDREREVVEGDVRVITPTEILNDDNENKEDKTTQLTPEEMKRRKKQIQEDIMKQYTPEQIKQIRKEQIKEDKRLFRNQPFWNKMEDLYFGTYKPFGKKYH
jgi:hypothetical protein